MKLKWSVISILLVGMLCSAALSAVKECRVLQYRHDRLYFPLGEDSHVFAHASFVVYLGEDSIYSGSIEVSELGVSYSFPTSGFFDTLRVESCVVNMTTADTEDDVRIVLGSTGYGALSRPFDKWDQILVSHDNPTLKSVNAKATVEIRYYKTFWKMRLDFEAGELDGCFSYRSMPGSEEVYQTMAMPVPYCAMLLPDVSRNAEANSLLTTSLYYRFDRQKHAAVFEGDDVIALNCLNGADSGCKRAYPYDPDRGRKLIRHLPHDSRDITVTASHENLRRAGVFFSDNLSRDRMQTHLTVGETQGDCVLTFYPFNDQNAGTTLGFVYRDLLADTLAGGWANETIAVIGKYIELGDEALSEGDRDRYYGQAEKSLEEDVGVFPLFRPTVHFTAHNYVRGYSFDPDGFFDARSLVKLSLPSETTELTQ